MPETSLPSGDHREVLYRLDHVIQEYEGKQVLSIDQLEIHKGEILAFIGPSGAGKSSLLRLLNFLETPSKGTIQFKGIEFKAGREMPLSIRRLVTMVFQQPLLLKRSVEANVRFGLRLRGKDGFEDRVTRALKDVGLEGLRKQRATTLSGGEGQRVSLARALVLQPEVLLLDEPTANLDPYNVGMIENIIADANRSHGTTIILVTHNVFQAKRLAHRVVLLLDGKQIETGPTVDFFEHPSDPRTKAFVRGEMVY